MPGIVLHNHFADIVFEALNDNVKEKLKEQDALYHFGSTLPNAFKYESFYKKDKRKAAIALQEYLETHEVKEYFLYMVNRARLNRDLFALLCGEICTFYLDIIVNPFIYYRSGLYKENIDNTIKYRGFIQKTNLAIDCYMIDNYYHSNKHNMFNINHKLLKLKKIPKTIAQDIDSIYFDNYKIREGFKKLNKIVKDQKLYYQLIFDPLGIKQKILAAKDDGKSEIDFNYLSYHNKLIDNKKYDIFNLKHNKWSNPANPYFSSIDSLFDLLERAKTMSVKCINELYDYIFLDKEMRLDYYFSDLSYVTGQSNKSKQELKNFSCIYK